MHRQWTVVAWGLALFAAGCGAGSGVADKDGASAQRASGVAIIDMDEVARQLGRDVTLVTAIRDGEASLNQQLRDFQATLQQKFREKAGALEAEPAGSPEGQKVQQRQRQLADLQRQFHLQLNQAKSNAQNELKAHQQRLVQRFREEVKPVAQEVAAQRGLGVVVTKNDSVLLAFDDAHDITAAVVAKLRAKAPAGQGQAAASVATRPAPPATQRR